jgi:hypothetical protein
MQTRPIPLFAFIAGGTPGHTNGGPPRIENEKLQTCRLRDLDFRLELSLEAQYLGDQCLALLAWKPVPWRVRDYTSRFRRLRNEQSWLTTLDTFSACQSSPRRPESARRSVPGFDRGRGNEYGH